VEADGRAFLSKEAYHAVNTKGGFRQHSLIRIFSRPHAARRLLAREQGHRLQFRSSGIAETIADRRIGQDLGGGIMSVTKERLLSAEDVAALPDIYAMQTDGNCLSPVIEHGTKLVFTKNPKVKAMEIGVIWFRSLHPTRGVHQAQVKQIVSLPPDISFPYLHHPRSTIMPLVTVRMFNPGGVLMAECRDILAIHKCIGFLNTDGQCVLHDFNSRKDA
jgi:hypothetical protein